MKFEKLSYEVFNCVIKLKMSETLTPRESGRYVAENAVHVRINENGLKILINKIIEKLKENPLSIFGFSQNKVHPQIANEDAINWIFVVDTLNFCFWSVNSKKWTVTWKGTTYTGYFALCAAINRALEEGYSITDPKYYSQISMRDLKTILRGDDELYSIPLLNKRLDCLHEVGLTLLEKFDGKFLNCILCSNNSSELLLEIIVKNFPCFKDEAFYKNKTVTFYKRAQILIGDIWVCFQGKNEGCFKDIEKLTMFADYRVPQVLVYFKTLEYSKTLMEKLQKDVVLPSGSEEEIEIRGCTIQAVELINNEIQKILANARESENEQFQNNFVFCNSVLIDHYLWDYRRQHAVELELIPFHKTLSIYY